MTFILVLVNSRGTGEWNNRSFLHQIFWLVRKITDGTNNLIMAQHNLDVHVRHRGPGAGISPVHFMLLHVPMSAVKIACWHILHRFNDILKCVIIDISCSVLLSGSVLLAPIFQVSAWLPHWSATHPNTRLCLFNNSTQPSVNGYRRAALRKHGSDRHTDLTWHFTGLQQLPIYKSLSPKTPVMSLTALGEIFLDFAMNDRKQYTQRAAYKQN